MSMALILLSLAALCLAVFGWLWLCAGFRRTGARGALGVAAVQVSGLCLAYGVLRGQPLVGVYTASFPPLALIELASLAQFPGLLADLARLVVPWAAVVAVIGLVLRPLRVWAPGLTVLAAMIGVAVSGDRVSQSAMCQAAASRGIDQFQRNSFTWSLTESQGSQGALHGFAEADGQRLGWSYRSMDWYALPRDVIVTKPGTHSTCAG